MNLTTINSDDCTWMFDTEAMRFRRVLNEGGQTVATEWRSYIGLKLNPDTTTFTIVLTPGRHPNDPVFRTSAVTDTSATTI